MRLVITLLIGLGALGTGMFVLLYAAGSRGWYRTPAGRSLVAWAGVLFALLALWLAGHVFGPLPLVVWVIGIAALDVAIWSRVALLWRLQR